MEYLEAKRVKLKDFQDFNELHAAVQEQMEGLREEDFYQCYEQWFERMNRCIRLTHVLIKLK
jgi:hypothetical protein